MTPPAEPLIFDIKRYSLDDGPGIRSTVFFKGCQFQCPWCHNPESVDSAQEIGFYSKNCILCGDCVIACPNEAISIRNGERIDRSLCTRCGKCVDVCPSRALRYMGRHYGVDELLEILQRDRAYYEVSHGGVTLSGGEPTLHMEYASMVLRKLKETDIHTAIQTNGYFNWEMFKALMLPYLDLVMFDVKYADGALHKRWTGCDNALVLSNLQKLKEDNSAELLTRIPLIPGFTATETNLNALSNFLRDLGCLNIFLLPYNYTWFHKNEIIGRSPDVRLSTTGFSQEEVEKWRSIFAWAELVVF